ncbi:response regulator [Hydrogenovibrio halophilus]|uniref:response regulator n=1 Tax=Hydrogenovibrio halophilus TaxID=373391 RepID=UPI00037B71B9|nr:response regulator [Hydrogenovibrio halophilus]
MKRFYNLLAGICLILAASSLHAAVPTFERVFENHPLPMLLIDPGKGQIVEVNAQAVDFYGYSNDVLTEMTIQQINTFTPEQVAVERQAAAEENRHFFIFRHRLASGETRRVQVYSYPYEIGQRSLLLSMIMPLKELALGDDSLARYQANLEAQVDEQMQALQQSKTYQAWWFSALAVVLLLAWLAQSVAWRREKRERQHNQELLQTYFEQSPAAIMVHDPSTGELLRANQQTLHFYGCESLQHLKQAKLFGDPPFSETDALNWIHRAAHRGPQQFEWKTRTASGEERWEWVQLTKATLEGQPRVVATAVDITVLKHAQTQLDELNKKFVVLLENTSDFIFFKDAQHRFEFSSQTVADINGYASWRELIGKTSLEVFPEALGSRYHRDEQWVLSHGRPLLDKEVPYLNKYGEKGWVQASKWPVFAEDGHTVTGLFGINRDITARIEMESALKQAKDKAEAANKAKSQFLANMSHELRTPMNGIIGLSELVPHENDPDQVGSMVRQINHSARLLLRQLDDVLDLVSLDSDELPIQARPFYLSQLLQNLESLFQHQAKARHLRFQVVNDGLGHDCYVADADRLAQVLSHLLSNALKFTFQGHMVLSVTHQAHADSQTLVFEVEDTGTGISEAQQEHLFEMFEMGDASNTRHQSGIGIGLVMSQKLIRRMGGDIDIESKEGHGTRVRVVLPAKPCDKSEEASLIETTSQPMTGGRQRVLIVEDNAVNQKVVAAFVTRMGLDYLTADNGEQAVDLSRVKHFDLVLMDIQMPGMDGYEATRKIRQYQPDVPVIAVTAAAMIEDREKSQAAGMNEHLSKPIMWASFTRAVSKWLDLSAEQASANSQSDLSEQPVDAEITVQAQQSDTESRRSRILVVDDAKTNLKVLANALKPDYAVQVADSGEAALKVVHHGPAPDLILLDIMMPEMDGFEVCRVLKNDPQTQDIPVIFVTALDSETDESKGFEAGGVDFIVKPFKVPVVLARVRNHLKLKQRTDMLEMMSHIDGLTQVPNRRQLDETLKKEMGRLHREQSPLGVIMIDIDHFKPYNDHYGHGRGDECLEKVAGLMQSTLKRPGDFLARYGGEEFVVLLPETDAEGTRKVGEALRAAVAAANLRHDYSSVANHVTISLGGFCEVVNGQRTRQDWLEQADRALYEAKHLGRNRMVVYTEESQNDV